ncbi:hypothetical protein HYZ78_04050 [Candidatus Microgenomates bacterium]|nr:hypothetical protein [Candidatus Microgenomates bacterium]
MITAHRTQIYLDDFRFRELKKTAQREKKSLAQVIRDSVDLTFNEKKKVEMKEKEKAWREFLKLAGIGKSGLTDLARRHDYYFAKDEISSWNRGGKRK